MARKHGGGEHEGGGGHGDRPWVYFMVDSFFLVTQFFVITFKVKADEVLLPQKLPPGCIPSKPQIDCKTRLAIHVSQREGGVVQYEFMTRPTDLDGLHKMLKESVAQGQEYQVRVSYDKEVHFKHVMAVFNACSRERIAECGLIPIKGNR